MHIPTFCQNFHTAFYCAKQNRKGHGRPSSFIAGFGQEHSESCQTELVWSLKTSESPGRTRRDRSRVV